jgi:ATP-dependent Zn protease
VTTEKYAHTAEESKEIVKHLAYHEAGHAVVGHYFEHPISGIWIMPESEVRSTGLRDLQGGRNGEVNFDLSQVDDDEDFKQQDQIVVAAGIQAEEIVLGKTLEMKGYQYSDRPSLEEALGSDIERIAALPDEVRKETLTIWLPGKKRQNTDSRRPSISQIATPPERFDAMREAWKILNFPSENAGMHALAEALMKKSEITGEEAKQILEDARVSSSGL